MRAASLFAGIGGFDLAAERTGIEIVWSSENDPHAARVLDHHFPTIPNLGDIHEITRSTLGARRADVDLLVGGFPCQDYSHAGTRSGLAGDRGALWWQYHRLIADLRPTWILGENVLGLLTHESGRDFEAILRSVTDLGYGLVWSVLDAQWFGVAQQRRRVFFVGHLGGEPRPEVLALAESAYGHPPPRRAPGQTASGPIAPGSQTGGPRTTDLEGHGAYIIEPHSGQGADLKARETEISPSLTATDGKLHERGVRIAFTANQRDEVRTLGGKAMSLDSRPGMKQQTFLTERSGVRRLTPLECERIQGFPDRWTELEGNPDTHRFRQLGNAVAVPVAEWILRRIVEA